MSNLEENIKEENNIQKAEKEFWNKCLEIGVTSWTVNPKAKLPYTIGVSTNWPNKPDDLIKEEAQSIVDNAEQISEKYNLETVYEGLHFAAGGALVMYVGFLEKKIEMPEVITPEI